MAGLCFFTGTVDGIYADGEPDAIVAGMLMLLAAAISLIGALSGSVAASSLTGSALLGMPTAAGLASLPWGLLAALTLSCLAVPTLTAVGTGRPRPGPRPREESSEQRTREEAAASPPAAAD